MAFTPISTQLLSKKLPWTSSWNNIHNSSLFRKLITRHVTFQLAPTWYYFEAYRLLSPSQRLLHPSQLDYYWESSLEHRIEITYTILLPFPEVNNSSRDFSIDTNLILFWSLPSSQFTSTASTPISTQLLSKKFPSTSSWNNIHNSIAFPGSE